MRITLLIFVIIVEISRSTEIKTKSPIIGVLTTPLKDSNDCVTLTRNEKDSNEGSCFHNLYVEWLYSAGARVVAVPYDSSESQVKHLFESLNGFLFTGGDTNIKDLNSTYMKTAGLILDLVKSAHASGDYVPLWGTCMGFQTLSVLQAGTSDVLISGVFDSDPIMLPLDNLTSVEESRMLTGIHEMNPNVIDWITSENITVNLHHDGVDPQSFQKNKNLGDFFRVISTNKDRNDRPFASTMEGKSVPVYGAQWHPERPQFEFRDDPAHRTIPHNIHAVISMHTFASFFVNEARKNDHKFSDSQEELTRLLYNNVPQGSLGDSYRAYIFPPAEQRSGV